MNLNFIFNSSVQADKRRPSLQTGGRARREEAGSVGASASRRTRARREAGAGREGGRDQPPENRQERQCSAALHYYGRWSIETRSSNAEISGAREAVFGSSSLNGGPAPSRAWATSLGTRPARPHRARPPPTQAPRWAGARRTQAASGRDAGTGAGT